MGGSGVAWRRVHGDLSSYRPPRDTPRHSAVVDTARMDDPLADARSRIDAIDREVLRLLAERAAVTRSLAAWKAAQGLGPRDPTREAEALGLSPWLAEAVTRAVLATTRGLDDDDRAAFARGP